MRRSDEIEQMARGAGWKLVAAELLREREIAAQSLVTVSCEPVAIASAQARWKSCDWLLRLPEQLIADYRKGEDKQEEEVTNG